jgi:hypothetical protein
MTEDFDNYFENMGETLVRALSRDWSGALRADAQLWLAARAREAQRQAGPASPHPATLPTAAGPRRAIWNPNTSTAIAPAVAAASLLANILMVAYLIH